MARHNREARGLDQRGRLWTIGYQPDWLSRMKISRRSPDRTRRSSLTVFRNPERRAQASPGRVVRTEVRSADGLTRFRVSVEDPDGIIEELVVVTRPGKDGPRGEIVKFALEARLPPRRR